MKKNVAALLIFGIVTAPAFSQTSSYEHCVAKAEERYYVQMNTLLASNASPAYAQIQMMVLQNQLSMEVAMCKALADASNTFMYQRR